MYKRASFTMFIGIFTWGPEMLFVLLRIIILLTSLVIPEVNSACPTGWFGPSCVMQCHCDTYVDCSDNGECPAGDKCERMYFGPGCQYVDLAAEVDKTKTETYLYDHKENTCNPHRDAEVVELTLKRQYPFLGFRIQLKQNVPKDDFFIIINEVEKCANMRKHIFSETIVDVTCDSANIDLKTAAIDGPIAPFICSVYINGGRNVGLKQTATQSSTLANSIAGASLAVDANRDRNVSHNSCSRTGFEASPWWSITFTNPCIVIGAIVHSATGHENLLEGFVYSQKTSGGQVGASFTAPRLPNAKKYEVQTSSRVPVTTVEIKAATILPPAQRALTLCEVELLGEMMCPDGKYGFACEKQCKCNDTEICHPTTGMCGAGCPPGLHGVNCLYPCSKHCLDGKCADKSGKCLACEPGYTGDFCETECATGTFGLACAFTCAKRCIDVCDFVTGICTCDTMLKGVLCTECPAGFYGLNCAKPCSQFCRDATCHIDTAECVGCIGAREGPFCDDCPTDSYGPLCQTKCSDFCVNKTCDPVHGNCSACTHGYTGKQCRSGPKNLVSYDYIILPILLSLILLFIVIFCLPRREVQVYEESAPIKSGI